ncbi:VOC family protein [Microlunatus elymi]|uniref:VOC family protein n=1 Tax=Microlunatus elymi TaxID=2596828 RepID=A0A516Q2P0_9ACTN|nr:VOC family protein [Microlunatus elymi]QDP97652.1 VOC family protein [Microlunatus elymi]
MTLSLGAVTVDSSDPEPIAAWWAEQLGAEIVATNDGWFVTVKGGGLPGFLSFQKVAEPTPGKNKIHLDLMTDGNLDATADGLIAAGALLVEKRSMGDFAWVTLADPQGNEFCVASGH